MCPQHQNYVWVEQLPLHTCQSQSSLLLTTFLGQPRSIILKIPSQIFPARFINDQFAEAAIWKRISVGEKALVRINWTPELNWVTAFEKNVSIWPVKLASLVMSILNVSSLQASKSCNNLFLSVKRESGRESRFKVKLQNLFGDEFCCYKECNVAQIILNAYFFVPFSESEKSHRTTFAAQRSPVL